MRSLIWNVGRSAVRSRLVIKFSMRGEVGEGMAM